MGGPSRLLAKHKLHESSSLVTGRDLQTLPYCAISGTVTFNYEMIRIRSIQVDLGKSRSEVMNDNNTLLQRFTMTPVLFVKYVEDMPRTGTVIFGYADESAMATQHRIME